MHAQEPVRATLVLDTRASARQLGLRDAGDMDRRLLFSMPGAYVELRIPAAVPHSTEQAWIFGQVVDSVGGRLSPRAVVSLHTPGSPSERTDVGMEGDFALPCDPAKPFELRYESAGASPVAMLVTP
jgi:hypothetical protein